MARALENVRGQRLDWVVEATNDLRRRWHNQKYFTWVEQLGRSATELRALASQEWWARQRALCSDIDDQMIERFRS
jgi:hypothetical protein